MIFISPEMLYCKGQQELEQERHNRGLGKPVRCSRCIRNSRTQGRRGHRVEEVGRVGNHCRRWIQPQRGRSQAEKPRSRNENRKGNECLFSALAFTKVLSILLLAVQRLLESGELGQNSGIFIKPPDQPPLWENLKIKWGFSTKC